MSAVDRITRVFQAAAEIPIDDSSKLIIMSDVHRGDGSWADDFSGNESLYAAAMTHYDQEQYTYIELGDSDELWKNKRMEDIFPIHMDTFLLIQKFHDAGRCYFIYGNHDMVKRNAVFVRKNFDRYVDAEQKSRGPLFADVRFHEGLILRYKDHEPKILLIHGHQGSLMDYAFWGLRRFLVRYVWKRLELFGFNDPTSTAKNYHKKDTIEQSLTEWAIQENHMLIAGHTHRPMFPDVGSPLYFNDGSCVHPRSITGIEISAGRIALVKWKVKTKDDGTLYIGRDVIAGPRKLGEYL